MTEGRGGFMVLTRGGGIGSGRNPYMWAGDQTRSWEKLDDQVLAVLNSGMSGIPFMSYDYGGYQYDGGSRVEPAGVMNLATGAFDLSRTTAKEGAPWNQVVFTMRMTAAAPIRPTTVGRSQPITPSNRALERNFV